MKELAAQHQQFSQWCKQSAEKNHSKEKDFEMEPES